MKISDFGLAMIEAFEGYFAKPYRDPIGVVTQGYGHTAMSGGEAIGGIWSKTKARQVLRDDLSRKYEPGVRKLLRREPTQGQWDAMVSFAFNCGVGALAKSSILKHFNRGDDAQAAASFALWNKAGGRVFPGLVRRRAAEALAYQGVQDLNFNGRRDADEPIYGAMPRGEAVQPGREKLSKSPGAAGEVVATGTVVLTGTGAVVDQLQKAEPFFNKGTVLGLAIGALILGGLVFGLYSRWNRAGRPLPAFLRRGAK